MNNYVYLALVAAALAASLFFWVFVLAPNVHQTARFMDLKSELYDDVLAEGGPDAEPEELTRMMLVRAQEVYSQKPDLMIAYVKEMLAERREACLMTLLLVQELRMVPVRKDVAKLVARGGSSKFKMNEEEVAQARTVLEALDEAN